MEGEELDEDTQNTLNALNEMGLQPDLGQAGAPIDGL